MSVIRTWLAALAALLIAASPALALTRAQIPTKIGVPWGQSAGASYIRVVPVPSQIGIQNCAASFTDGFPPLTFLPAASGGCGPFGQDTNGILNIITLWNQWANAGGPMPYDATFQTTIGGYPRDALVQSNILHGRVWISTADNNTTNPDDQTGAAINWQAQPGTNAAGIMTSGFAATAPLNNVVANGLTVGNAASNATNRANADCYWLFVYLWTNCATCNLFNSGGGGIGRGASAAADWNANDAIATPSMSGRGVMGVDGGTGRLTNVPVTSGSISTAASVIGENLHPLTVTELAAHNHTITDPGHTHVVHYSLAQINNGGGAAAFFLTGVNAGASNTNGGTDSGTTGVTINNTGSGTGHNTVQQSYTVFWYLAL